MLLQNQSLNTNSNAANANIGTGGSPPTGNTNSPVPGATTAANTTPGVQQPPAPNSATVAVQPFTDWGYIAWLILIIIVFGTLGGWVSHLLNSKDEPQPPTPENPGLTDAMRRKKLAASLVVGIAAAFLVPLFLQTISSQLLREGYTNYLALLVFASFCLISAISSKAFIQTLSNKVLQAAEEARFVARAAKNEAEEAKKNAADAQGTASSARNVALVALPAAPLPEGKAMLPGGASGELAPPEREKETLIREYNSIRENMKPGWSRTAEMGRIFRRMIELMPQLPDLDVGEYLTEKTDPGRRLLGYAYFFAYPKAELLPALVDSVVNIETKPFAQYWGILAIGKVLTENTAQKPDPVLIERLRAFLAQLKPGTDRWKELKNILEQFDRSNGLITAR